MTRHLPAAALFAAFALWGGPRAEAAVSVPEFGGTWETPAAASTAAAPSPDRAEDGDDDAPHLRADAGTHAGSPPPPTTGPVTAALPSAAAAFAPAAGPPAAPLPDRCLRPQLYPGGLFRPPKGA